MPSQADILSASILIVDDKEANVQLLEQLLQEAGYQNLTSTRNPYSVCALHELHRFDLILLDLQMPGLDGFEVMTALKKMEFQSYAPILAITVQPGHKLRALATGAKDFIAKPFDLVEVKTRIYNMLEVRLLYKKLQQTIIALESFALHDPLTKLPNRRLLMDRLRQSRLASARTQHHAALMFMDIDHFKQLNDSLGHDMGDVLLQQVSERLLSCARQGDSVARFGGDEFVVLLDALSSDATEAATQAEVISHKMRDALGQSYSLSGHSYDTSLSIGIVIFRGDSEPIGDLLKKADLAMYQAKADGRNTVRFFDPVMQTTVMAHDALARDLHRGLAMQEFVLHGQIQVDVQGRPVGAEAMLRWNHRDKGLMVSTEFIKLAEQTGMLLTLGQWLLEASCHQLLVWAASPATANLTLAVNVSDLHFAQSDFATQVASALKLTGANPHRLTLELTQSCLFTEVQEVIAKMNAIKDYGVRFSLNGFGTGICSFSLLKHLPLNQMNIAPCLVRNMLTNASDAVIVRTIKALADSLDLQVTAQGIETQAQRSFLIGLDCQVFQGEVFGSVEPALEMLHKYTNKIALEHDGRALKAINWGALI